ncbi:YciI family protein [uncultured Bradyrhizobium sp.]|uniref:YciI family protein n=1 Tax=uncultured Bradyrhizobium sp. TaxID=199684 RepID=UPI002636C59B|nr:YciI family protein [uncultured Bradyrhizobium sp.]
MTDGPFAETKEFLAGLYIVECDTIEQAAAYARRHPGASFGSIEIRPIGDFDLG